MVSGRKTAPPFAPPEPALELGRLYETHAQTVARWAARLCGPALDAEDIVQEVFLVVERRLAEFRGEAPVTTWLYRITANVVRHQRRKQRWRRFLGGSSTDVAGEIASSRPTPIEELERRRAAALVYRVLDGMAEKYRSVLILFELEGLSGETVAGLLGLKMPTVWVRLHRARALFLERLRLLEPPQEDDAPRGRA
jgi:RNA polymerase sigma-70 factor (ECF subfamily)